MDFKPTINKFISLSISLFIDISLIYGNIPYILFKTVGYTIFFPNISIPERERERKIERVSEYERVCV